MCKSCSNFRHILAAAVLAAEQVLQLTPLFKLVH
jgi:hypothetical protein